MTKKLPIELHWSVVSRGMEHLPAFDLYAAVEAAANLIVGHTQVPYEYRRGRIEDGNGNEVFLPDVTPVLNYVPALLLEVKRLRDEQVVRNEVEETR